MSWAVVTFWMQVMGSVPPMRPIYVCRGWGAFCFQFASTGEMSVALETLAGLATRRGMKVTIEFLPTPPDAIESGLNIEPFPGDLSDFLYEVQTQWLAHVATQEMSLS